MTQNIAAKNTKAHGNYFRLMKIKTIMVVVNRRPILSILAILEKSA